jgi:hypothetical protein
VNAGSAMPRQQTLLIYSIYATCCPLHATTPRPGTYLGLDISPKTGCREGGARCILDADSTTRVCSLDPSSMSDLGQKQTSTAPWSSSALCQRRTRLFPEILSTSLTGGPVNSAAWASRIGRVGCLDEIGERGAAIWPSDQADSDLDDKPSRPISFASGSNAIASAPTESCVEGASHRCNRCWLPRMSRSSRRLPTTRGMRRSTQQLEQGCEPSPRLRRTVVLPASRKSTP